MLCLCIDIHVYHECLGKPLNRFWIQKYYPKALGLDMVSTTISVHFDQTYSLFMSTKCSTPSPTNIHIIIIIMNDWYYVCASEFRSSNFKFFDKSINFQLGLIEKWIKLFFIQIIYNRYTEQIILIFESLKKVED